MGKYSEYSKRDIIMSDMQANVADLIEGMAYNEEMRIKLADILDKGGCDGFSVCLDSRIPGLTINKDVEAERRLEYAYFLARNPEAFEIIKNNNAKLFHGTKIQALPSILKHGINSFDKSQKSGIEVTTGEYQTRISDQNRDFVSFTDSISTALLYSSELNSEIDSVGVMICMSPESLENLRPQKEFTNVRESTIKDNIPVEHIKALIVQKEKVEFVKSLVGELQIEVIGADMDRKFYSLPTIKKIEYLMNPEKMQQPTVQEYTQEDMQKNAKTGKLSRIMKLFDNIKEKLSRKDRINQYGEDGR